jgi:hypothetical protein
MPRSRGILLLGSQEVRITAGYSRARPSPPTFLHKNTYVCFYVQPSQLPTGTYSREIH